MFNSERFTLKPDKEFFLDKSESVFIGLLFLFILCIYALNLTQSLISPDGAGYPLVSERLLPGWLDGKPAYIWMGKLVFETWRSFSASRETLIKVFALYSALFGAMAAVNVYLIFRALFSRSYLGGMVSMLLAFAPVFFYTAVTIEVYTFNIFWITLAILSWIKKRYLLWGIAWGLALASHVTSSLLFLPFVWSLLYRPYSIQWKRMLVGSCLTLSIVAVSYGWVLSFYTSIPAFIEFFGSISRDQYLNRPTVTWVIQSLIKFKEGFGIYLFISGGLLLRFRKYWLKAIPILVLFPFLALYCAFYRLNIIRLSWSCGYILTGLCIVASVLLYGNKGKREPLIFLLLWVLPYAALFLGWIQDGGQFYIYLVPPMALITGGLFNDILTSPRFQTGTKGSLAAVVFLFVFALSGGLYQRIGEIRWLHTHKDASDQYALQIKKQIPSGSVILASWMNPIIRFYAPDLRIFGFPFYGPPLDLLGVRYESAVKASLNGGGNVFVTKEWLRDRHNRMLMSARERILGEYSLSKISDDIYKIIGKEQGNKP